MLTQSVRLWMVRVDCGSFLAIQMTSPLTMAVAGTIKVILNGLLTVRIFGNQVTWLSLAGSVGAVAGVTWYNWLRLQAMSSTNTPAAPAVSAVAPKEGGEAVGTRRPRRTSARVR